MNITPAQLTAMLIAYAGGNPWNTRRQMAAKLRDAGLLDDKRQFTAAGLRYLIAQGSIVPADVLQAREAIEARQAGGVDWSGGRVFVERSPGGFGLTHEPAAGGVYPFHYERTHKAALAAGKARADQYGARLFVEA